MARSSLWVGVAGLLLAAGGFTTAGVRAAGYLAVTGPAPLRFRLPGAPAQPLLSPLPRVPDSSTTKDPVPPGEPVLTQTLSSTTTNLALSSSEPPASSDFISPPKEAAPFWPPLPGREAAPEDWASSPQLILGYLLPAATNAPAGSVLLPAFVPPLPPPPPRSSQAIYESR